MQEKQEELDGITSQLLAWKEWKEHVLECRENKLTSDINLVVQKVNQTTKEITEIETTISMIQTEISNNQATLQTTGNKIEHLEMEILNQNKDIENQIARVAEAADFVEKGQKTHKENTVQVANAELGVIGLRNKLSRKASMFATKFDGFD